MRRSYVTICSKLTLDKLRAGEVNGIAETLTPTNG